MAGPAAQARRLVHATGRRQGDVVLGALAPCGERGTAGVVTEEIQAEQVTEGAPRPTLRWPPNCSVLRRSARPRRKRCRGRAVGARPAGRPTARRRDSGPRCPESRARSRRRGSRRCPRSRPRPSAAVRPRAAGRRRRWPGEGDGQDEAVVVVRVLPDQVDPTRGGPHARRIAAEAVVEEPAGRVDRAGHGSIVAAGRGSVRDRHAVAGQRGPEAGVDDADTGRRRPSGTPGRVAGWSRAPGGCAGHRVEPVRPVEVDAFGFDDEFSIVGAHGPGGLDGHPLTRTSIVRRCPPDLTRGIQLDALTNLCGRHRPRKGGLKVEVLCVDSPSDTRIPRPLAETSMKPPPDVTISLELRSTTPSQVSSAAKSVGRPLGTGEAVGVGAELGETSPRTDSTRAVAASAVASTPLRTPRRKLRTSATLAPALAQRKAGTPVRACLRTRACISTVPS